MDFQQEAPVYLQVRRSNLENLGIVITDPYDYMQVIPYVTCFINQVSSQYFMPCVEEKIYTDSYINPKCQDQTVKVSYTVDELTVGGSTLYSPVLYSSTLGLLAGTQLSLGIEQNLGCYEKGTAPTDTKRYHIVVEPQNVPDPNIPGNYLIYKFMGPQPVSSISVDFPTGYNGITFAKDNSTDPPATAPGYFIFRVVPMSQIQLKP